MRFWIGTLVAFLGPALAGGARQSAASVIVYTGFLFWWFIKVQPVRVPPSASGALLMVVLFVLAALAYLLGGLVAGLLGWRFELPFWLPSAVSILGVVISRPPAGRIGADG